MHAWCGALYNVCKMYVDASGVYGLCFNNTSISSNTGQLLTRLVPTCGNISLRISLHVHVYTHTYCTCIPFPSSNVLTSLFSQTLHLSLSPPTSHYSFIPASLSATANGTATRTVTLASDMRSQSVPSLPHTQVKIYCILYIMVMVYLMAGCW